MHRTSHQHIKLMYSLTQRPEDEVDWQSGAGLEAGGQTTEW